MTKNIYIIEQLNVSNMEKYHFFKKYRSLQNFMEWIGFLSGPCSEIILSAAISKVKNEFTVSN